MRATKRRNNATAKNNVIARITTVMLVVSIVSLTTLAAAEGVDYITLVEEAGYSPVVESVNEYTHGYSTESSQGNVREPESEVYIFTDEYTGVQLFSVDHGHSFITGSQLQDYYGNPQNYFGWYASIRAVFTYEIPLNTVVRAGDTMAVTLPPELQFNHSMSFIHTAPGGEVIGTGFVDHISKTIMIIFSYFYYDNPYNRSGTFQAWTRWDINNVEEGGTYYINLPNGPGYVTAGRMGYIDENETLLKYGWQSVCRNYIFWRARVNVAGIEIPGAKFRDTLGYGIELVRANWADGTSPWNVWVEVGYFQNNEFVRLASYFPDISNRLTVEGGGTSFVVKLGDLIRGNSTAYPYDNAEARQNGVSVIIHYTTRITDGRGSIDGAVYNNSALVTGSNGWHETAVARVRIENADGTGDGHRPDPDDGNGNDDGDNNNDYDDYDDDDNDNGDTNGDDGSNDKDESNDDKDYPYDDYEEKPEIDEQPSDDTPIDDGEKYECDAQNARGYLDSDDNTSLSSQQPKMLPQTGVESNRLLWLMLSTFALIIATNTIVFLSRKTNKGK